MEREKEREREVGGEREGEENGKKTHGQTFILRGNGQFCYGTSNFRPIDTGT